ncbi:DUF368 domain-containing protein [Texcoconibacillus texcoconensis]|uniref:Putative membrane protein n=1 Tax=Texcoconibacillus texcoconensis TaxID=1095777 RepID=A0A840QLP5_9BACI|nr:DUF368 domain-containing protein [Texcoconibacillus texcoconensis]MBB5172295.1 putative membrane protein [Texcoconibacillus texcoconensis]
MIEWKNIYRGFMMGTSDLIPGVSGGTIAMVLGIYQRLIAAINGLFSKEWKKHVTFLIPLGFGVALALVSISNVMDWLLSYYPQPTYFFFLGLIIGIIPFLLKTIDYRRTFSSRHYLLLIIAATLISLTMFIDDNQMARSTDSLVTADYIRLFFSGWVASSAMILPGVSGSFVFLLFGTYELIIASLSSFQLEVLVIVAAGIGIGVLVTSKIIHFLLARFTTATYATMTGFIIGSIFVIFPGISDDFGLLIVSIVTFFVGAYCALLLGRLEHDQ